MVRCDGDSLERDRRLRQDPGMSGRPSGSEGLRRSGEVGPKGRSARRCAWSGVGGHLQEVEDAARVPGQIAHGLGDAEPARLDEADGEAAQSGRYVPLSPRLLEQLRGYWRRERPRRWLFPGRPAARPMSRSAPWDVYQRAKNKAGISKAGGIHTLRHNYATGLLEAGVELPVIQRRLGHSSIRSTMRYLHLASDKTSATPSPLDLLEFPRTARA